MKINSFYPVILTNDVQRSKDFYTRHFPFEVTFDAGWYVSLKAKQEFPFELALLEPDHATIPTEFRSALNGGLIQSRGLAHPPGDPLRNFWSASLQHIRPERDFDRHYPDHSPV